MKIRDLFTVLAKMSQCEYISDLPLLFQSKISKAMLAEVVENDYPLADWNDAIHYLTNTERHFSSCTAAKEYLSTYLK